MVDADMRQWSWWAGLGENAEYFTLNEASREEVILAARREYGAQDTFTIVEATQDGPFTAPDFDDDDLMVGLLDRFSDANSKRFGEDGLIDFPRVELERHLQTAFQAFLDEHGGLIPVYAFTEQRNREVFAPVASDA